jgi:hypothetical protein
MMNKLCARLMTEELGRVLALVYDDGTLIDRIRGTDYQDVFTQLQVDYPLARVFTRRGATFGGTPAARIERDAIERYFQQSALGDTTSLDIIIAEIMREIGTMQYGGKLRSFIEGEPIGCIPLDHRADLTGAISRRDPTPKNARHK